MKFVKRIVPVVLLIMIHCSRPSELVVKSQPVGPWVTNCYLIYDSVSKEAALIDVGVSVDTLLAEIREHDLKLKYILITHGHQDHIAGVPKIKKQFPDAKLCFSKAEYDAFPLYSSWRKIYQPEMAEVWQSDSTIAQLMDMDYGLIGEPDIYVNDNHVFNLGGLEIKSIALPGHSKGSMGYYVENALFSGDLIYFHSVGYLDYELGSKKEIIESAKRLYDLFPDSVAIYAGHGPVSTIGFEKKSNAVVTQDEVKWQ